MLINGQKTIIQINSLSVKLLRNLKVINRFCAVLCMIIFHSLYSEQALTE